MSINCSRDFSLNKSITLTGRVGGFASGPTGIELVFAAGSCRIRVGKGAAAIAPSQWRSGPPYRKFLPTVSGTDVGLFVSAGRGDVDGDTVESFGSDTNKTTDNQPDVVAN